jgi:hypothetical protein
MNRTTKLFTIQAGGTPQPLVGTWITANTSPGPPDSSNNTLTTIPVNDSSMFKDRHGDYAYLVSASLTNPERVLVTAVPDGTHITVKNLQLARVGGVFGTGDFVSLSIAVNSCYSQNKPGNAGTLYIGTQGLVKATLANVIAQLLPFGAGVQPIEFSDTRYYGPNPGDSSDFWIDGTTGDGYLPSFGIS